MKGNLAEDIVALMHEAEGVTVEPRVTLPTVHDPQFRREIDVLITSHVSGYPVRIAIECKNYADLVTHVQIDEFAGKLEAVGIPSQHGIFVTVNGFNKHALSAATRRGIQTFVLNGLSSDRIKTAVWDAFQLVVYLQANIMQISLSTDFETSSPDILTVVDSNNKDVCLFSDLIWTYWKQGRLPQSLGEHTVPISLPEGWGVRHENRIATVSGSVVLKVVGLVVSIRGDATYFTLNRTDDLSVSRAYISSDFDSSSLVPEITSVESEGDLTTHLDSRGIVNIMLGKSPLPRIVMLGKIYWPPSDHAMTRVYRKLADSFWRGQTDLSVLQKLGFRDIEGYFLDRAFDAISSSHPAGKDPDWPGLRIGVDGRIEVD